MVRRMLSVWLSRWPIDRLRRCAATRADPSPTPTHTTAALEGAPFALTLAGQRGLRVVAINEVGEGAGVRLDMSLADARAVCPALQAAEHNGVADAYALLGLARWMGRYSPWTNGDGSDGLLMDVSGCAHLFGGERAMLAQISADLERLRLSHRLGLADTRGAAWAAARYGRGRGGITRVPSGETKTWLARAPIEGLRLEPDIALLLRRLGLRHIGDLYTITRMALGRRFTTRAEGEAVLTRLDQLLGRRAEPFTALAPVPEFRVRRSFIEPLMDGAGIDAMLPEMLADLMAALAHHGRGAQRLGLGAYRVDGGVASVEVRTGSAGRDANHFIGLFKERLQVIDPKDGIDLLILSAEITEALAPEQVSLTGDEAEDGVGRLTDRLANRLGRGAVYRVLACPSHIPERAQCHAPVMDGTRAGAGVNAPDGKRFPVAPPDPGPHMTPPMTPPRPFRLFERPEPMEVMAEVPEGPPLAFRWRRMRVKVARAEGPERLAPEWWQGERAGEGGVRDYYRIEDEAGHRFWVYRDGLYRDQASGARPRWYMHGFFG